MTNLLAGCDGFGVGAAEGAGARRTWPGALQPARLCSWPCFAHAEHLGAGRRGTLVPGASCCLLAGVLA